MININDKEWLELTSDDIKLFLEDAKESFFYEFKQDDVSAKDLIKEISALSNTYGGYIFIGISDKKRIIGCEKWNEERIHTVIRDSITPIPIFDVREFKIDGKEVNVLRINEGPEPPYITNKGLVYERISSSSAPIEDSNKLNNLFLKREDNLKKISSKISISPITVDVMNLYGYIDMGFAVTFINNIKVLERFQNVSLEDLINECFDDFSGCNLMRMGNSIVFNMGNIYTEGKGMPAHANNFIEIMCDGSARMRLLLLNNNFNDYSVNMFYAVSSLNIFKRIYKYIFGDVLEDDFVYAKKYEKIKTIKQFNPTYHYESEWDHFPEVEEKEKQFQKIIASHQSVFGVDTVVTDDRIPKTGLYMIDKEQLTEAGEELDIENIVEELFVCSFAWLGYVEEQDSVK